MLVFLAHVTWQNPEIPGSQVLARQSLWDCQVSKHLYIFSGMF